MGTKQDTQETPNARMGATSLKFHERKDSPPSGDTVPEGSIGPPLPLPNLWRRLIFLHPGLAPK